MFQSYASNVSISFSYSLSPFSLPLAYNVHISFIYSLSYLQLFWLHKCTATGKRVAMQGCHQSARYLLDAHLLGTSHLRLASSISHLTHPALSCPQGGPGWPLPFRTELRFPASQFVSVCVCLCVFVCICRPLPDGDRVFPEFSTRAAS